MEQKIFSSQQQIIHAKRLVYALLKKILKVPFYSQAGQDVFVSKMLNEKKSGFYLEVGGGHPTESNNTYLLEARDKWTGLSLEYDRTLIDLYNSVRLNKAVEADATCFDYLRQLDLMNAPAQIDYLSIDIDPAENTYKALLKIPHDTYRFSVITYEHDKYQSGEEFMNLSRSFLEDLGYQLVVSNLKIFGNEAEDWWVDPGRVPFELWNSFKQESVEFTDLW
jgi:hypothetical protein